MFLKSAAEAFLWLNPIPVEAFLCLRFMFSGGLAFI